MGLIVSLIAAEYYQIFLSFSVLGGISSSTLWSPPVAAVGHWFNKRRGLVTGVACTAGGIGGVIFPLIILFVAPRIGFAWSLRVIALLCAVLCAIACLTVKTRLPPKKADSFIDLAALRDMKYASTSLAVFFVEFSIFTPITYIVSYALHVGVDEKMAYAILVFLNLGAVFGRFLPGLMADKWGRFNVMVLVCLMCALFTLILWLCADLEAPTNLGMVISYAVLFGFWGGATISLVPVCISQVCDIQDYGKRVGTTWTLVSFGTLIGIPIAGAIQQHNHGEYYGLIVFGGVLYAVTTVAFIISRGICHGWSLWSKF
ncbi:MFS general substrate transporter [Aspergillus sclerotiicarbonarius CBS 121057]|uniref:MFS general substrate transporter n=1 Tax=Aspergillus sclerotiicarbonarius (strain CBS 121057 / IBT 28362) TaxID=1448318 RepID=A0A319EPN0_ASPSB|nr:MFS general substrate transporter [Aspergillus sclerotiicarbonarius CBS 121057]